jgi:hypothetical protein
MDLQEANEILNLGPVVSLGILFGTIDVQYPDCSGAGCPCNKVVGCLQQVRSDLQTLLQVRQCYKVFLHILANIEDRLV